MTKLFIVSVLVAVVGVHQAHASSTSFSIRGDSASCRGDFDVDSLIIDCGDDGCTWGSSASVTGQLTVKKALPSETGTVKVKAVYYPIYEGNVDFCDGAITPSDGVTCPGTGTYTFQTGFPVPGDGESWYSDIGGYFTVQINFDYGGSKTSCNVGVVLTRNGYKMSYTAAAVGSAVGLVGLAAVALGIRRRRRTATLQLDEENGDGPTTNFEMMRSDGVQV